MKNAIITICGKNKNFGKMKAIDLYKSNIFPILRKNNHNKIDIWIISAKYGLINENDIIENYNEFMTKEKYLIIKDKIIFDIKERILNKPYKKIMTNLGGYYIRLFNEIKDKRLIFPPFLRKKKIIKEFILSNNNKQRRIDEYEK